MAFMTDNSAKRVLRFIGLAAAAGALIYAISTGSGSYAEPVKAAADRKAMPDFSLRAMDGSSWTMSQQRGKVILLNFWATWCPPCRTETPELVRMHNRYSGQGFEVVGISMDDDPQAVVPAFVERFRMPYKVLTPTPGFYLGSQVESLPTSVLIDREGRLATIHFGAVRESDLRGDVEQLLAEAAR
jgi:peroxiredoxin